jgi:hypothetical protein
VVGFTRVGRGFDPVANITGFGDVTPIAGRYHEVMRCGHPGRIRFSGEAGSVNPMCVLLANEPRAYRDTLAVALRLLRPTDTIIVAEPDTLDRTVLRHRPHVVVCSELTSLVESQVPTWVVLYPDGSETALRHLQGERAYMDPVDLAGIAQLCEQTGRSRAS